jgi:hypothetical protein
VLGDEYAPQDAWKVSRIEPGTPLLPPEQLFKKLDVKIIDEELERLRPD